MFRIWRSLSSENTAAVREQSGHEFFQKTFLLSKYRFRRNFFEYTPNLLTEKAQLVAVLNYTQEQDFLCYSCKFFVSIGRADLSDYVTAKMKRSYKTVNK